MWTAWSAFPQLDRLIDDVMTGAGTTVSGTALGQRAFSPDIDIRSNAQEIVFVCDVPGLKHEDLDVSVDVDTLTIKGKRAYEGSQQDHVWLNRSFGSFSKSFKLPENVDAENLTASLADGVLTVRVPRKAKEQPRRIQVAIGGGSEKRLEDATK
jgi:HSP20 family protein